MPSNKEGVAPKVVSLDDYRNRKPAVNKGDKEKEALAEELGRLVDYIDRNIMPLDQTGPIG